MSYEIMTEEETDGQQVATSQGWGDFVDWVDGLDVAPDDALGELVLQGWTNDLSELDEQIRAGLEDEPPSADVRSTAEGILEFLGAHGDAEMVMVTNGVMAADDDDEDDDIDDLDEDFIRGDDAD